MTPEGIATSKQRRLRDAADIIRGSVRSQEESVSVFECGTRVWRALILRRGSGFCGKKNFLCETLWNLRASVVEFFPGNFFTTERIFEDPARRRRVFEGRGCGAGTPRSAAQQAAGAAAQPRVISQVEKLVSFYYHPINHQAGKSPAILMTAMTVPLSSGRPATLLTAVLTDRYGAITRRMGTRFLPD